MYEEIFVKLFGNSAKNEGYRNESKTPKTFDSFMQVLYNF